MSRLSIELHKKLAVVQLVDAKKPMLVQLRQNKDSLYGVLQNHAAGVAPDKIPIHPDEILSVFPHNRPLFGKVYQVEIEPWVKSVKIPHWGQVTYFRELSDAEDQNLQLGLDITHKRFVKRNKLNFLLPINLEIRTPRGKQVGMFHLPKGDREPWIDLMPSSFIGNDAGSGADTVMRIATHELSHAIWKIYLSDKMKARWIKLYHSFAKIHELTVTDLANMRDDVIGSKITLAQYRRALDDEAKLVFDVVIMWIKKIHHLNSRSLDLLRSQGDDLNECWPRSKLHLSELKIPVTPYSATEPEEFFCESMSLASMQQKMPKAITKLIARTLRNVKPK